MENTNIKKITELNDLLRDTFLTWRIVFTHAVASTSEEEREEIITKVREFNNFTPDNDPCGEHGFGAFIVNNEKYFWKIGYYNIDMSAGSENPGDQNQTTRVLTIMRTDEF